MGANVSTSERKQYSFIQFVKSIWFFMAEDKVPILFWTTLIFLSRFYDLVFPILIGKVTDFFIKYHTGDSLTPFYVMIGIFGVSYAITSIIRATSKNKVGDLEIEAVYRAKVTSFERLLDFSLKWHDSENTGNKVQKILNGTGAFKDLRKVITNEGLSTLASIIGITVVFFFLKSSFVIFVILYFAVFSALQIYFNRKQQIVIDKANKALEQASGIYYEGLNNVLTIKTLGAKDSFKETVYSSEEIARDLKMERIRIGFLKQKVIQIGNAVVITIYLFMVGQGVLNKSISVGTIFIFYSYLNKLIDAVWEYSDISDSLLEIKVAIMRMMPIYKDNQFLRAGKKIFPINWHKLYIANGSFSHKNTANNEESVFSIDDLNFKAHKYEKIGVVGHSGSGKSTLAKILLGLYDLEKGEFKIDDINFYDLKHTEITRNVAIVLQDSEMFNLSLKDNITLLKENPTQLLLAVKVAQLEDLIKKLPEGINTIIGEKGYRLSGGERQRIGIARAIFKDPQIFVFDEATSSLDSKTEHKIQEALETLLSKKTMIIIAHRLSTLKNVNRIYVFENGKVIEEGKYNELISNPSSTFYKIYQFQSKQLGELES